MPRHVPHGRDLRLRGRTFSPGQTALLAIINRTPDSFYDAGRYLDDEVALSAVALAVADGADAVDIGGAKQAPGPRSALLKRRAGWCRSSGRSGRPIRIW